MPGKSTRHTVFPLLIGLFCMVASVAPSIWAQTEQTRQITIVQDMVTVGLTFGQTLRYSWANRSDSDPQERDFEPLRIGVRLLAADGSVIAEEEAAAISAGRFQFFDFKRSHIRLPGEAGSGRLQMRLQVKVIGRVKYADVVLKRGIMEAFDDAVEVIDDASGETAATFGGGRNEISMDDTAGKEYVNPKGYQIISAGKDHLIGIIPGQTLRLSAVNPLVPAKDGRHYKMLFAVTILDAAGTVVAQSDEIELDPGTSHSFEFKREDLHLVGEADTGRVQVRAVVRRFFHGLPSRISQGESDAAPAAMEIIDTSTGKTRVLLSQKPKEIVVVGSK